MTVREDGGRGPGEETRRDLSPERRRVWAAEQKARAEWARRVTE